MTLFYETTSGEAALTYVKTDMVIESTTALLSGVMARLETIVQNDIEENSFRTLALLWDELPLMAENDDISTLKAARGSKQVLQAGLQFSDHAGAFCGIGGQILYNGQNAGAGRELF